MSWANTARNQAITGKRSLSLSVQPGGSAGEFSGEDAAVQYEPCGMSAWKGEVISTGAFVHMGNLHLPFSSSVAKALDFIRIMCCQGFVRTTYFFYTRFSP